MGWRRRFAGVVLGTVLAAPAWVTAAGERIVPVQSEEMPMDEGASPVIPGWPPFEALDRNSDGFVHHQDLNDADITLTKEQFAEVDVNQDGRLDPIEYQLAQALFADQVAGSPEWTELPSDQEGSADVALDSLLEQRVSDLEGQLVNSAEGGRIGQVSHIVIDERDNRPYAVISMGGILGFGAREAAVPVEELRLDQPDQLVASISGSAAEISRRYPYDEGSFRAAEGNRTLAELVDAGRADGSLEIAPFEELDRDRSAGDTRQSGGDANP